MRQALTTIFISAILLAARVSSKTTEDLSEEYHDVVTYEVPKDYQPCNATERSVGLEALAQAIPSVFGENMPDSVHEVAEAKCYVGGTTFGWIKFKFTNAQGKLCNVYTVSSYANMNDRTAKHFVRLNLEQTIRANRDYGVCVRAVPAPAVEQPVRRQEPEPAISDEDDFDLPEDLSEDVEPALEHQSDAHNTEEYERLSEVGSEEFDIEDFPELTLKRQDAYREPKAQSLAEELEPLLGEAGLEHFEKFSEADSEDFDFEDYPLPALKRQNAYREPEKDTDDLAGLPEHLPEESLVRLPKYATINPDDYHKPAKKSAFYHAAQAKKREESTGDLNALFDPETEEKALFHKKMGAKYATINPDDYHEPAKKSAFYDAAQAKKRAEREESIEDLSQDLNALFDSETEEKALFHKKMGAWGNCTTEDIAPIATLFKMLFVTEKILNVSVTTENVFKCEAQVVNGRNVNVLMSIDGAKCHITSTSVSRTRFCSWPPAPSLKASPIAPRCTRSHNKIV